MPFFQRRFLNKIEGFRCWKSENKGPPRFIREEYIIIIPVPRGYCFGYACPGRFSSHFVRVIDIPSIVYITHKWNLYHLKPGCLACIIRGSVFPYRGPPPPNFGVIGHGRSCALRPLVHNVMKNILYSKKSNLRIHFKSPRLRVVINLTLG